MAIPDWPRRGRSQSDAHATAAADRSESRTRQVRCRSIDRNHTADLLSARQCDAKRFNVVRCDRSWSNRIDRVDGPRLARFRFFDPQQLRVAAGPRLAAGHHNFVPSIAIHVERAAAVVVAQIALPWRRLRGAAACLAATRQSALPSPRCCRLPKSGDRLRVLCALLREPRLACGGR